MTGNVNTLVQLPQGGAKRADELLFQLQLEQFDHDEKYHREISRLSMHQRLNHMALHFAKYTGRLSNSAIEPDVLKRTVTDTFVISLSCSNILNFRLWEKLGSISADNLLSLGQKVAENELEPPTTTDGLFRWIANASGQMAAACEKLDHIEDFPFRVTVASAVVRLAMGALIFASAREWDLFYLTRERLAGVKNKSILHGCI
jgi:hypothetical protein